MLRKPPRLVEMSRKLTSSLGLHEVVARMSSMPVGALANCSGYSAFMPIREDAPLLDFLNLVVSSETFVRRIPIVDSYNKVVTVLSSVDFLQLALGYGGPTAILKSRDACCLDRRETILDSSVSHEGTILSKSKIMFPSPRDDLFSDLCSRPMNPLEAPPKGGHLIYIQTNQRYIKHNQP